MRSSERESMAPFSVSCSAEESSRAGLYEGARRVAELSGVMG